MATILVSLVVAFICGVLCFIVDIMDAIVRAILYCYKNWRGYDKEKGTGRAFVYYSNLITTAFLPVPLIMKGA